MATMYHQRLGGLRNRQEYQEAADSANWFNAAAPAERGLNVPGYNVSRRQQIRNIIGNLAENKVKYLTDLEAMEAADRRAQEADVREWARMALEERRLGLADRKAEEELGLRKDELGLRRQERIDDRADKDAYRQQQQDNWDRQFNEKKAASLQKLWDNRLSGYVNYVSKGGDEDAARKYFKIDERPDWHIKGESPDLGESPNLGEATGSQGGMAVPGMGGTRVGLSDTGIPASDTGIPASDTGIPASDTGIPAAAYTPRPQGLMLSDTSLTPERRKELAGDGLNPYRHIDPAVRKERARFGLLGQRPTEGRPYEGPGYYDQTEDQQVVDNIIGLNGPTPQAAPAQSAGLKTPALPPIKKTEKFTPSKIGSDQLGAYILASGLPRETFVTTDRKGKETLTPDGKAFWDILNYIGSRPESQGQDISTITNWALMGLGYKSGSSQGNTASQSNADQPPVPGAKKAPDGNWYVKGENGKWNIVE